MPNGRGPVRQRPDPAEVFQRIVREQRGETEPPEPTLPTEPAAVFARIVEQFQPVPIEIPPVRPTPVTEFFTGIGEEILRPTRIFRRPGLGDEDHDEFSVSRFVGQLVGFGVSLVPFVKGPQLALRAFGVAKPFANFLGGALGWGLFEVGAGTPEEIPKRFATGVALGALFEGMFLKKALREFEASQKLAMTVDEFVKTLEEGALVEGVNPMLASVAAGLNPRQFTENPKAFWTALKEISDVDRALDESFSRLAQVLSWEGRFTLPGIANPADFVNRIRRANPNAKLDFSFYLNPETKLFSAMVIDTAQPRSYLARMYRKTIAEPRVEFGGSGQAIALDPDNMPHLVRFLRTDLPEEIGVRIEGQFTIADLGWLSNDSAMLGTSVAADFSELVTRLVTDIPPRLIETGRIRFAKNQGDILKVGTLVHELAHHVFHRRGFANVLERIGASQFNPFNMNERQALLSFARGEPGVWEKLNLPRRMNLKDFFGHKLDDAEWLTAMQIDNVDDAVRVWEEELKAATEEIMAIHSGRDAARSIISGDRDYYHRSTELLARFAELVLYKPETARRVAPNFYDVFANVVMEESPKLRILLSRGEPVRLLEWMEAGISQAPPSRTIVQRIFTGTEDIVKTTDDMKAFFRKHGFVQGEEVSVDGMPHIIAGATDDPGFMIVRNIRTGATNIAARETIDRFFIADVLQARPELRRKIMQAIRRPPRWLGVNLRDPRFAEADGTVGVRRAVLELDDIVMIDAAPGQDAGTAIRSWINTQFFVREEVRQTIRRGGGVDPAIDEVIRSLGLKGVIVREEPGIFTAWVVDQTALRLGDDVLNEGLVGMVGGTVGEPIIRIDVETAMRSLLADAGATEAQMPYFMKRVRNDVINRDLLALVDDDVRAMVTRAQRDIDIPAIRNVLAENTGVSRLLRHEVDMVQNADGTWSLINRRTGIREVTVQTAEDASKIYNRLGVSELDPGLASPVSKDLARNDAFTGAEFSVPRPAGGTYEPKVVQSTALANPPPQTTESPQFVQSIVDAFTNMAPWAASLEAFAKMVERTTTIPAYRNFFLPAQRAFQRVLLEFERVPRPFLEGRTYTEQLKLIQNLQRKVGRQRSFTVRGLIEVLSREEIEAGALSATQERVAESVLRVAREFERLGVNRDIARIAAQRQMVMNAVRNKERFLASDIPRMINRRDIDPIVRETAIRLKNMADDIPDTLTEGLKAIGLSENEIAAARMIDGILEGRTVMGSTFKPADLFVMSRWGDAAPLKPKFKTARAQYIAEQKMTETEIKLAQEVQRMMYTGFGDMVVGSRMISGYWSHMRKWVDAGFRPRKRGDLLREILPADFMEWSEMRLRSGELDVYESDMVLLAYKIARSLLMKEHFDPHISGYRQILRTLTEVDPRAKRIMEEYLDELIGKPHVSFRRLNEAVARSMEIMGFRRPFRTAERMINNMTALAYGASIPFRISLILRNYYQMVQMIPARIGPRWFEKGLEKALTREGFEEAVQAGAVPLGITPVFASTQALGHEVLRGADLRVRRLFEKGFDWYRKADDVGRAVAYHGQKQRLRHYYDQFVKRQIDYDTFKARAKVNTFDTQDIAIFDDLMRENKVEEAFDHLGFMLSRETHFRYGAANHPAGWGSVPGRLFGQFGTWPVQYKDYLVQGLITRGSAKDKAEFFVTHFGVNMGLVAAGGAVGLDLWNWASIPSLNYTGGPMADLAIDFFRIINGSPAERAMAKRSIMMQWPTLEDPRSIFLPGSYFLGDLWSVFREGEYDPQAFAEAAGFRFFEPQERSFFETLWDDL